MRPSRKLCKKEELMFRSYWYSSVQCCISRIIQLDRPQEPDNLNAASSVTSPKIIKQTESRTSRKQTGERREINLNQYKFRPQFRTVGPVNFPATTFRRCRANPPTAPPPTNFRENKLNNSGKLGGIMNSEAARRRGNII